MSFTKKCENCIRLMIPQSTSIQKIKDIKSYMTGLKYKSSSVVPQNGDIYQCIHDPENKYDSKAIQIVDNSNFRVGYIPKQVANEIVEECSKYPDLLVLLCYCIGKTTERSAQCFYFLFKVK